MDERVQLLINSVYEKCRIFKSEKGRYPTLIKLSIDDLYYLRVHAEFYITPYSHPEGPEGKETIFGIDVLPDTNIVPGQIVVS